MANKNSGPNDKDFTEQCVAGVDSGRGQDRITRSSGLVFSTCIRL